MLAKPGMASALWRPLPPARRIATANTSIAQIVAHLCFCTVTMGEHRPPPARSRTALTPRFVPAQHPSTKSR